MKRKPGAPRPPWTIEAYETDGGVAPAWSFIRQLEGRDKIEAIALVKLLEEKGSLLRRPHSGTLGDGLFELRGKQVRLFYMFVPGARSCSWGARSRRETTFPPERWGG
jgi:hypothetical protein